MAYWSSWDWREVQKAVMGDISRDGYTQINVNTVTARGFAQIDESVRAAAAQVENARQQVRAATNMVIGSGAWTGAAADAYDELSRRVDRTLSDNLRSVAQDGGGFTTLIQEGQQALSTAVAALEQLNYETAQAVTNEYNRQVDEYNSSFRSVATVQGPVSVPGKPRPKEPWFTNAKGEKVMTPSTYPVIDQAASETARKIFGELVGTYIGVTERMNSIRLESALKPRPGATGPAGLPTNLPTPTGPGGLPPSSSTSTGLPPISSTPTGLPPLSGTPDGALPPLKETGSGPDGLGTGELPGVSTTDFTPPPGTGVSAFEAQPIPGAAGGPLPLIPLPGGGFATSGGAGTTGAGKPLTGLPTDNPFLPTLPSASGPGRTGTVGGAGPFGTGLPHGDLPPLGTLPGLGHGGPSGGAGPLAQIPASSLASSFPFSADPPPGSARGADLSIGGAAGATGGGAGSGPLGGAGVGAGPLGTAGVGGGTVRTPEGGVLPPGAGTADRAGSPFAAGGMPYMPMMPGAGGAGGGKNEERERTTWLLEDRDIWAGDGDVGSGVIRGADQSKIHAHVQAGEHAPVQPTPEQPRFAPAETYQHATGQ